MASGTGDILPSSPPVNQNVYVIWNHGANTLNVYPAVGQDIYGVGTNLPVTIAAGSRASYTFFTGTWVIGP